MEFTELGLEQTLLETISKLGIETCTEIQESAIPHLLEGRDVSGLSQTGTGKTFAFLVPVVDRILKAKKADPRDENTSRRFQDWKPGHFILILAPTRELVEQIHENAKKLCDSCGLKTTAIYGGVGYEPQKDALNDDVDIVVGTPGRLIDLYKSHALNLKHIRGLIFDEADRMFDMGFKDDMVFILQRCPQDRQIMLFSATLNFDVLNTIYRFGSHPVELNVSKDEVKTENIQDEIFHVGESEKPQYLLSLIKRKNPGQTIIFSNFKSNVDRITKFLNDNGLPAVGISSLLTQPQREKVLNQFKNKNERNILVATDVAARGLDIKGVDLVVNYELPDDAENYVHRVGRTGRAGETGVAYSLVCDKDVRALNRIEGFLQNKIEIGWVEDDQFVKDFKDFPPYGHRGESRVRKTGLAAAKESSGKRRKPQRRNNRKGGRKREDDRNKKSDGLRGQSSAPSEGGNVHRDRRSGRHKDKMQAPQARTKTSTRKRRKSSDKQWKNRRSKGQNKNRQNQQRSSQSQKGFVQKALGLFKKLLD